MPANGCHNCRYRDDLSIDPDPCVACRSFDQWRPRLELAIVQGHARLATLVANIPGSLKIGRSNDHQTEIWDEAGAFVGYIAHQEHRAVAQMLVDLWNIEPQEETQP